MAGDSGADWTTAASPNALESVTGSGLTATTRVVGVTRVRSSTTTSRFLRERPLRIVLFVRFFLVGIQTSTELKFMYRKEPDSE
jgi:hypothetical protein